MDEIEQASGAYLDHLAIERGLSNNTVGSYRRDLARYHEYLAGAGIHTLGEITPETLRTFLQAAAAGEDGKNPLAASSIARLMASLRGFHGFAQTEHLSGIDPTENLENPRLARPLPKALSITQTRVLLEAFSGEDPASLRSRALLETLYASGARVSEVCALDVDDLGVLAGSEAEDSEENPITLVTVTGKGNKQRLVPLGEYAVKALEAYLVRARPQLAQKGRGSSALFLNLRGGRLSRQSAWNIIREAAEKAGIKTAVSPHSLRHSFATHMLEGGADVRVVQELLGHVNVTTTQIYTKVTATLLREVYQETHPRAR
ncbi:MAG: site-specific tyrosine recombinase XerD [Varibaculum cambriense]|uniref:site-specific tyrosine recombinase XerD n=1 Tax=Varibaculum cambriense TaxID=184870 RepID=UPI00241D6D08|nr:site-specific tyrosine recombinase XerD [Varibaculum cambriense]MBS5973299.1 site-specific tyrosine recombinase XerD [Varibaculum cambriense]